MTKRMESKYRLDRRMGQNIWGRPKSPVNRREYGPGQHGQRRKKPSDYGIQLMAKQKLKGYYGNIGERQFRRLYDEAVRRKGDTGANLLELLERLVNHESYSADLGANAAALALIKPEVEKALGRGVPLTRCGGRTPRVAPVPPGCEAPVPLSRPAREGAELVAGVY